MFDQLRALRVIRDDLELTSTEKLVLLTAVARTDKSGRVRASQQQLAADSSLTVKSIKNFYKGKAFPYYFNSSKQGRMVVLHWNEAALVDRGTDRGTDRCTTFPPSTSTSTTSTTTSKEVLIGEEAIRAADLQAVEKLKNLRLVL